MSSLSYSTDVLFACTIKIQPSSARLWNVKVSKHRSRTMIVFDYATVLQEKDMKNKTKGRQLKPNEARM